MLGIATALVILGASIAPFLTPLYVRLEQDRAGVSGLTGYSAGELDQIAGQILGDLVLWQGDFHPQAGVGPMAGEVLTDSERSHMLDVRNVFTGLWAFVLAGFVTLVVAFRRARAPDGRTAVWRSIRNGAVGLAVVIAVAGVFAAVAFDTAFEAFHRLFFSAGTYTFDPATSKLIQLFPERFWSETAIIVGVVIVAVAVLVAFLAARRAAPPRLAA